MFSPDPNGSRPDAKKDHHLLDNFLILALVLADEAKLDRAFASQFLKRIEEEPAGQHFAVLLQLFRQI